MKTHWFWRTRATRWGWWTLWGIWIGERWFIGVSRAMDNREES